MVSGSPTPPLAAQGSVKGSSFLGRSSSEAVTDRELMNMKEDLQAVQDEAAASKEVIAVLRQQVEELQKEKEALWVIFLLLSLMKESEFWKVIKKCPKNGLKNEIEI